MICFSACPEAIAQLQGSMDAPDLRGQVRFFQEADSVLVVAEVCGLPQNTPTHFFAMHIHQGGACTGEGFAATQGHFNPTDLPHPLHAGDLPPLLEYRGRAFLAFRTDRFRVREVLGRTLVIHGGSDDFRTQPSGDPGPKIACGVIRSFSPRKESLLPHSR